MTVNTHKIHQSSGCNFGSTSKQIMHEKFNLHLFCNNFISTSTTNMQKNNKYISHVNNLECSLEKREKGILIWSDLRWSRVIIFILLNQAINTTNNIKIIQLG